MKILLINTGGTIACRATSMGLQPQLTAEELFRISSENYLNLPN